jgi:CO/xanthine dehydrogenase Mo-binding subunit
VANFRVIGKSLPSIEGEAKVAGKTIYTADFKLPGMLWAKALRSQISHARIVAIDASRAKSYPGVRAVLTAEDVPATLVGRRLEDMPILARDRVRFMGEKLAVVAAEDPNIAEEAAQLIDVQYEDLPAVFDPLEAIGREARPVHDELKTYHGSKYSSPDLPNVQSRTHWGLGNVDQGFRESDRIFEHEFRTQSIHQGYLEPNAAVVAIREDGRVHVWAANKVPFELKKALAKAASLAPEKIVVHVMPLGGDFGGKGALMDVALCYFLARQTGRPVKMVMNYAEELMAISARHPAVIRVRTGVKKDGLLVARKIDIFWNGGAYGAMKPNIYVNLAGARFAAGAYHVPHVSIDSYVVYTNSVPSGHFRAPGFAQVTFAAECQMDTIAKALGIDPLEIRLRNAIRDGDPLPNGRSMTQVKCREVLKAAGKASHWGRRQARSCVGRGLALSYKDGASGDANASLRLHRDGTVSILTTYADQGAGTHTIIRQIAAEVLNIPERQITVQVGSTDNFETEIGVGAARVAKVMGRATEQGAGRLKEVILTQAAAFLDCTPEQIEIKKGLCVRRGRDKRTVSFAQLAHEAQERGQLIEAKSYYTATEPHGEGSFCAVVAEVEVDVETGQVRPLKLVAALDVARILNPLAHQGQIDGGIIQGVGFALMEEIVQKDGRILTLNLGDYKLPSIQDIPALKTILIKEPFGSGPFQTKPIGETSIVPIAAAIANAVHDATGVRIAALPITAEAISEAARARG